MGILTPINNLVSIWQGNSGLDKVKYLLLGIVWQIRKRLGHIFIKRLHTGALVKVYPSSSYSAIFYFKWYELEELKFIRKFHWLANTFVDVGANVGLFSLHVFDCFKSIYLFEPCPSTFQALKETCDINPNIKWHLHNIGLGDEKKLMTFIDEGNLSSTNRFIGSNISIPQESKKIPIQVDLLDNLIPKSVGNIILKVDVEGFEERVFKGATRIFSEKQVRLVMFERLGRTNLKNIKEFFKSHDYVIFALKKNGIVTTDDFAISKPLINLFAMPNDSFEADYYSS